MSHQHIIGHIGYDKALYKYSLLYTTSLSTQSAEPKMNLAISCAAAAAENMQSDCGLDIVDEKWQVG